ncbi:hypothetical protein GQ457_12G001470 [Hibiscus cannabinus]
MDSKVPSQKVTQELARELLIAISYSVPDTDPNSNSASKIVDGTNGAVAANVDEVEKYRSELISISDDQSPDAQIMLCPKLEILNMVSASATECLHRSRLPDVCNGFILAISARRIHCSCTSHTWRSSVFHIFSMFCFIN